MDGLGDEDDGILWERNPEKHRAVSKMMSPAFSGNSLRAKIPTLNKHIDLMISQMRAHGQQSAGLDVGVVCSQEFRYPRNIDVILTTDSG